MRISKRTVEALKPPPKGTHSKVWYDDMAIGFGVRVSEAGVKSFVLNYSVAGRERRLTVGRWPQWSADAAREETRRLRVEIDKGIDPLHQQETARGERTLTDLADDYIKDYALIHKRPKSVREDRRLLNKIILPKLGKLRVSSIDRRDIEALHNSQRETPFQGNRALALLSKIFSFAINRKMGAAINPVRSIPRYHEAKREEWLTVEQLHAISKALDEYEYQDAADAIRLLIVTGARPHEVIGATWAQFDLKRGIWTKPSHHTKQKKTEHTPLNPPAMTILLRMWEARSSVFLFPGRDPKTARTTMKNAWLQVCKLAGLATQYFVKGKRGKPLPRWKANVRVYDLRHTFASILVQRGASLSLVGRLLGHATPTTTNRYAHHSDSSLREIADDFGKALELPEPKAS